MGKSYIKAKQLALQEGYKIAFSNPCFELWFLMHFASPSVSIANCKEVVKLLKKKDRLEDYEKNKNVYHILQPLENNAIIRANKRIAELNKECIEILSRESNPVTTVSELVEYLNAVR